jgi:hypothetical protein
LTCFFALVYCLSFPGIAAIKIGATINFNTRPKLLQTFLGKPDYLNSFFLQVPCKDRFIVERIFKMALKENRLPQYGFEVFPIEQRGKLLYIAQKIANERPSCILSHWTIENWESLERTLQTEKLNLSRNELKEKIRFLKKNLDDSSPSAQ